MLFFFRVFDVSESIDDFWFLGDGLGNIRKPKRAQIGNAWPGFFHRMRTSFGRHLFCKFLNMLRDLRPIKHDGSFDVRVLDSSRFVEQEFLPLEE